MSNERQRTRVMLWNGEKNKTTAESYHPKQQLCGLSAHCSQPTAAAVFASLSQLSQRLLCHFGAALGGKRSGKKKKVQMRGSPPPLCHKHQADTSC